MELITQHKIYFSNKELIPLSEVAESLLALEKIIKQSPTVLEEIFPGLKIQNVHVFINELHSGSLWEDIVVKFIFGSQQKFDEVISSAREKIGLEYLVDHPKLLAAILLALVLTSGYRSLSSDPIAQQQHINTIEINNNIVINIGAELSQMSPEEFKSIIENSIKDNNKLTKSAIKFIQPAKRDKSASITFDNTPSLSLPPETIKSMPGYVNEDGPLEEIEELKDIEILIRATDLDHKRSGWGAVIPSISDRRTRLQLDPTINTNALITKRSITGDVTVLFKFDDEGKKVPKLYFLRNMEE